MSLLDLNSLILGRVHELGSDSLQHHCVRGLRDCVVLHGGVHDPERASRHLQYRALIYVEGCVTGIANWLLQLRGRIHQHLPVSGFCRTDAGTPSYTHDDKPVGNGLGMARLEIPFDYLHKPNNLLS